MERYDSKNSILFIVSVSVLHFMTMSLASNNNSGQMLANNNFNMEIANPQKDNSPVTISVSSAMLLGSDVILIWYDGHLVSVLKPDSSFNQYIINESLGIDLGKNIYEKD